MIRRPPRSTLSSSSAASDVYKRQDHAVRMESPYNGSQDDSQHSTGACYRRVGAYSGSASSVDRYTGTGFHVSWSSGSTLGSGHDRSEDHQTHLGESWSEMGGLAWIPARPSDKPLSARRLRQDDSGDIASRERFHDHEPVRQGRGIGCSGRDAGLRSGFMQRLCNGSGFGPIYGCCTMMKINTFLMRRDV